MRTSFRSLLGACAIPFLLASTLSAESLPRGLQGTWRITRILPTTNNTCWGREQAEPLVGSTLTYREGSLRWRGGEVPLVDVTTRKLTAAEFSKENTGAETPASFRQLGIQSLSVLEVDLQHEDLDITGATTEAPGDSVLLAGSNRIVVSACGVFFEAARTAAVSHTSYRH